MATAVLLLLMLAPARQTAGAAHVIISYRSYHKLRDGTQQENEQSAHLYEGGLRGGRWRMARLTFGASDASGSAVPPDGRRALFRRRVDGSEAALLCLLDVGSRTGPVIGRQSEEGLEKVV